MRDPLRVLLAGTGTRGKHWARIMHDEPLCRTVGYVDVNPANLAEVNERWPAPDGALFTDLGAALDTVDPDLVVLATPPVGHLEQAKQVFAGKRHLLSEKPLTLDLAEAIAIVRGAQEAGVSLTVGLNFRYLAATIEAKRIFAARELGEPSFGQYLYWTNRDGGRPGINKYPLTMRQPMLYEQSIHHLDLFRFTYDAEVARVSAITHNPSWSMYADDANVFALIEMTNGIVVNYFGTWSGTTQAPHLRVAHRLQRRCRHSARFLPRSGKRCQRLGGAASNRVDRAGRLRRRHAGHVPPHSGTNPGGGSRADAVRPGPPEDNGADGGLRRIGARAHGGRMDDFYRRHAVPQEWL